MPELPEAEVVRAGLAPAVSGATVRHVEVADARSLKRHRGPAQDFVDRLTGRSLLAAVRRGKFIWLPIAPASASQPVPDEAVVLHLGMSGQALLRTLDAPRERHLRVRLHLALPMGEELALHFVDQRIFGSLAIDDLLPDDRPSGHAGEADGPWRRTVPSQVSHIARDPLDPDFDAARFAAALHRRRSEIKRALLDQTLVSGIGNIYADEALWASRIHPRTPADALTGEQVVTLLDAVRTVLQAALAAGGTSFDAQYLNVNGQAGYFERELNAYGRHGEPCRRCGATIVRESFMNRSSHYCPVCQTTT